MDEEVILNVSHLDDGFAYTYLLFNNTATNYQIETVYQGEGGTNATLMGLTPNGTEYVICTALQYYGYKPSTTAAALTVEPQSTSLLMANKTPEEMQAEAEQSGWLSFWHEWSWLYPWYRLHVKIHVGNTTIDIGFNPILPGGETHQWNGLEIFAAIASEVAQDMTIDVVCLFVSYLAAKALSVWNPAVGIIAELVKGSLQFGLLVAFNWNSKMELLVAALVSILMGFIALSTNLGKVFISALWSWTISATSAVLSALHWKLLDVLFVASFTARWWLDALEAAIDWAIAGIALARYFALG